MIGEPPETRLQLLSVVIPARDEEGCVASTVEHLHIKLRLRNVPHEIVVVDDGSTDATWEICKRCGAEFQPFCRSKIQGRTDSVAP